MKNLVKLILFATVIIFTSCKTKQKLVYFQNSSSDSTSKNSNQFYFQSGDIVSINVSCADPELVKPFNNNFSLLNGGGQDGYESGVSVKEGYYIDQNGDILFPVIGKIKLGGLDKVQAIELLNKELKVYVKDPIVTIRLSNFRITVLGSVVDPGTFIVPNERMTILEALALAKDLKITGLRKNVLLIRENQGKREEYRVDLTSKDLFYSPAFYLKQNDIIYVEPNLQERGASTIFRNSFLTTVSVITLLLTVISNIVAL